MSWAAVIAGGAAIIGGVVSSQGSKKAANTYAQSGDAAINEQQRQFNTIQQNTAPYRAIGNQAINALGAIYGYAPAPMATVSSNALAGSQPTSGRSPGGFFDQGIGAALNPYSVTGKLGTAGKIFDPAGGILGNVLGGHKGSHWRNWDAFNAAFPGTTVDAAGNYKLPEQFGGATVTQKQLDDLAGTWYGATFAPDGNQQDWQQKFTSLASSIAPGMTQSAGPAQNATAPAPQNSLTAPDYSSFYKSPDYTFRQSEGLKGIERTAAARGGAFSGNALKALNEFNSNLAAGGFNDYFNHQAALAGIGQTATAQNNQAGLITGQGVSNALQNQGDARASGVAGSYNAWGNALSGLAQGAGYYFGNRNAMNGAPMNGASYFDQSGIGYFTPTQRRA